MKAMPRAADRLEACFACALTCKPRVPPPLLWPETLARDYFQRSPFRIPYTTAPATDNVTQQLPVDPESVPLSHFVCVPLRISSNQSLHQFQVNIPAGMRFENFPQLGGRNLKHVYFAIQNGDNER
jgi:hypothetical protein